jgi:thiol-disulfide isomerase/thioredoxin
MGKKGTWSVNRLKRTRLRKPLGIMILLCALILAIAGAWLVLRTSKPASPARPDTLASLTENGVEIVIRLERDAQGNDILTAMFTAITPGFHVYSKDIPRDGIDGLGRPTLLELPADSKMQAVGILQESVAPLDEPIQADLPELLVYPDGPVTLSLPVKLPQEAGNITDSVSVTYMACSQMGCKKPVEGKIIPIRNSTGDILANRFRFSLVVIIACLSGILTACQSPLLGLRDTATPTPSATPSPTDTPTTTVTPTATPSLTPSHTPTSTSSPTSTHTPTTTPTPTSTATSTRTVIPTHTPLPPSPTPRGFVMVELEHANGKLAAQLRSEAQKAQELGLKPFAEFTATWCPPCQMIARFLEEKNPLMVNAFDGTYIIHIDVDSWTEYEREQAGFEFEYIPVFFRLDAEGKPTGDWIDGWSWEESTPKNMAPPLKQFFQEGE